LKPGPGWTRRTPFRFAPFPKCIIEEWLPHLDLPCLRVYIYLLLRTWGHGVRRAAIPVTEIAGGRVDGKGKRWDHGTGLSERTVRRTIEKLSGLRLLAAHRERGKVTEYQVETAWSGIFNPVKPVMKAPLKESVFTKEDNPGHSSGLTTPVRALALPTERIQ
jgi:hypothetical protein